MGFKMRSGIGRLGVVLGLVAVAGFAALLAGPTVVDVVLAGAEPTEPVTAGPLADVAADAVSGDSGATDGVLAASTGYGSGGVSGADTDADIDLLGATDQLDAVTAATAPAVAAEPTSSTSLVARVELSRDGDTAVRVVIAGYEDVILAWGTPAEALMSMTVDRFPQRLLRERHGVAEAVSDPVIADAVAQVRAFFASDGDGAGDLRVDEAFVDGRTVRVVFDTASIDVVFLGGWESGRFVYDSTARALGDLVDGGYIESIITSRFGATEAQVRPALAAARALVAGGPALTARRDPADGTDAEADGTDPADPSAPTAPTAPTTPPVTRDVELPASEGQLARVEVSREEGSAVRLVFVGYEDVILVWQTPAEALRSMTVDRYPQRILEQRHGVPRAVSDPLVQAAADEVRTFFQPDGEGAGSLEEVSADAGGREVRVIREAGSIQVVFGGGWEGGAFVYDSVDWALSDLVDGGYVESKIIEFFGATPDEVRPALAVARGLVTG